MAELSLDFDGRRAIGVAWKWRWLIVAGGVIGLGAGMVDLMRRRPVYRASARVLVERQGPKLLKFNDSDGWIYPQDVPFDTHASLMRTPPIAARVATIPEIAARPEYAALAAAGGPTTDGVPDALIDALLSGLTSRPSQGEFGIIDVSYVSGDADLSALLANSFAEQYIQDRLEASLGLTRTVGEWVDARLREHQKKLGEAETALQEYREKWSFVGPEKSDNERLASLRGELDASVRSREESERRRDQLRRNHESLETASAVAEVAGSDAFRALAAERTVLVAKIAEESTKLGPKHPDMRKLTSRLEQVDASLSAEVRRLGASADLELERASARENAARAALEKATREALTGQRRQTEFARLEREVELNRQIYEALLRRLKSLGLSMDAGSSEIRIVARARAPSAPYAGRSLGQLLQALGAGLMFALGLVFLREYFDQTVKGPDELEVQQGLPLLGVVPLVPASRGSAPLAEAFSAVRSALVLASPKTPPRVMLVTSAGAGEGKSTASFHLASALARDGLATLLIEADLRRPVLHERLGVHRSPGLAELLASEGKLEDAVRTTDVPRLFLLPAGAAPPNPSELLGSERMAEILRDARTSYARIVVDSPPIFAAAETLALADSAVLTSACDGVILVVRARATTRVAVARARSRLARAKLLGAVLNGWTRSGPMTGKAFDYEAYEPPRAVEVPKT